LREAICQKPLFPVEQGGEARRCIDAQRHEVSEPTVEAPAAQGSPPM